MFARLDEIPWSQLRHAYGPATDLPQVIRDLVDESRETRDDALTALCGNNHHQGTTYDSSPVAIPFLVEALGLKVRSG